ncbi:MAG: ABC transporter substrate-binding protein [Dehalococcoidales bacterium]
MRLWRLGIGIILLGLLFSMVAGCQRSFTPGTFTDDLGREVQLKSMPQRIVSLAPSHTEILFALGLGDRVVGVTRFCNYPEEAMQKEKIGGFADPDPDKIIALKPDLILAFGSLQKSEVATLEERGQTVFWLYPHSVKDVLESFERIGKLTGSYAAAQQLSKEVEEKINAVQSRVKDIPEQERVTIFRVMGLDPPGTIGGQSFQTDVYHLAGGKNIFADTDKDYFELELETLIKLDPEVIVICNGDGEEAKARVKSQEGWENLTAVKADRIVVISCDLICRPSPRIGQTIEELAKKFYPERF